MTRFSKPAIRISNVVRGRVNFGIRVRFFLDPTGKREGRAIPENVVLKRWCARTMAGFHFAGDRLPPTVWRGIPIALGPDVSEYSRLAECEIGERVVAARLRTDASSADMMNALIAIADGLAWQRVNERQQTPRVMRPHAERSI